MLAFDKIRALIQLLESKRLSSGKNPKVSQWSVAEQAEHSLAVIMSILKGMLDDTLKPEGPLNLAGRFVLVFGWMPRGRIRSPKAVLPKTGGNPESIEKLARISLEMLSRLEAKPLVNGFQHPRMGWLTPERCFRFLEVHTNHHLKIIRDIETATPE